MTQLSTRYDPQATEGPLYEDWMAAGLFHAEPEDEGEPFSMVIPPPNVTGALHIGHALTNAIEDAMVRRARMQGRNAVWIPGMDHAGIATQNVVERHLAEEGVSRNDLGREEFIRRVWRWKEESGGLILRQLRRLGASLDWEREAFTFDEPRSRAVREVFVRLYEQGLIYRGYRLINWCPRCATALSDIEVEHVEVDGQLVTFTYPWADGDGTEGITVATTRAETMLGDTAIAVHPEDERYRAAVGREVVHPFLGRRIRVIADDYVDPDFGTGAVKITPAHDPNDYEIGQRHGLEMIDVMTDEAAISEAGGPYAGLDRFEARAAIVRDLDERGLLVSVEEHRHPVGHCSRCDSIVEPRLSDQWFVEVRPLADRAAEAVRDGRTSIIPERLTPSFVDWLENLHDWCISRQIWWGHRIPAWYCPDGHITVARTDAEACETCGSADLVQDPDVLDTWFSSQLWPFTVLGWEGPDSDTPELRAWYPTSVLETGYDINTFWVSRMLMIGLWFLDEVPFRIVYNHGMVRDQYGKKMSKSFGNVIDPLEFIDSHGADALRFALFQHTSPGTDVPLAPEWVEGAGRFANKLWNATRFALGTLEGTRPGALPDPADLELEDRWILSRLDSALVDVEEAYETWDWSAISDRLYHFAWDELADWYLEAAKPRLYGDDADRTGVARAVLARVLDDLLRLLHPLMPFVTEALWRALTGSPGGKESLMVAQWPARLHRDDSAAEADFAVVQDVVTELRRFRSQHGIKPSHRFPVTIATSRRPLLERQVGLIEELAGIESVTFVPTLPDQADTSQISFSVGEAQVVMSGLVDVEAELGRLERELGRAQQDLGKAETKLANESFVERAPAEVVAAERERREGLRRTIEDITSQMAVLRS